jgi:hypothetical protein
LGDKGLAAVLSNGKATTPSGSILNAAGKKNAKLQSSETHGGFGVFESQSAVSGVQFLHKFFLSIL